MLWIKRREIGWMKRAKKEEAGVGRTEEARAGAYGYGRADSYEHVWRQILFPGKSAEDGTLTKEEYSAAVAEWEAKADIAEEANSETR